MIAFPARGIEAPMAPNPFIPGFGCAFSALTAPEMEDTISFVADCPADFLLRMSIASLDRVNRSKADPRQEAENRLGILQALLAMCRLLDEPIEPVRAPGGAA